MLKHQPVPLPLASVQVNLPFAPHHAQQAGSHFPQPNWRYSFDDFVVGPCNELAVAASRHMCGADATDIFYLHSAPGLGKTHLMQATGKYLCEHCNRRNPRVEYLTAEEFSSRFYLSLKTQDTESFKARYRDVDLLLLEDIHFFQGKEKMQQELLNTIKAVVGKGSKVVFTSSFSSSELKDFDEQLHSRLVSGLISPIERPDRLTRKRILQQKAKSFQVILPEEIEDALAEYIRYDVRQLESCLRNLTLKAKLLNCHITMDMALDVIGNYVAQTPVLDFDGIVSHVCKAFDVSHDKLCSSSRKQEYVLARNTIFFLARKHTELSLQNIGKKFNRKHSTVLKGITNIERDMSSQTPGGKQVHHIVKMIEKNGGINFQTLS